MSDFSDLVGRVVDKILISDDKELVIFYCSNGDVYEMYHVQDCCESVYVDDICGHLSDITGSKILKAEEVSQEGDPENNDSLTWTFYKLSTKKGSVTITWRGESNGYYSEEVSFGLIGDTKDTMRWRERYYEALGELAKRREEIGKLHEEIMQLKQFDPEVVKERKEARKRIEQVRQEFLKEARKQKR